MGLGLRQCIVELVSIWAFCTNAQNERIQRPFDNGHGWDIRLAVPGEPGHDYPILNSIPRTSFTCSGKEPGYYADIETNCQVFRVCTLGATYGYQSFLCPNGTLFNQAVFVCDWWMQVNCQKTTDIIKKNNDQFGKLKLGPEFMTDIKKMITHPMRNPYNSAYAKNNYISMQEYKPPTGQLYSGNNYKNFQQSLSSFIPKTNIVHQNQQNYFKDIYSNTDISFAASTPSTHYIHNYNSLNERKQHLPFQDLNKARNTNQALLSNSHGGQFPQNNNKFLSINTSPNQSQVKSNFYNNRNLQTGRQTTYSIDYSKQQLKPHIKQEQQLYLPGPTRAKYSRDIIGSVEKETKQNLVSNESQPRLITKTLAFRKIVKDSKDGTPRSRITFKTWIVRPSKNSKLITNSTYRTNDKSTNLMQKVGYENVSSTTHFTSSARNNNIMEPNRNSNKFPRTFSRQVVSTVQEVADTHASSTTPYTSYKAFTSTKESPIHLVPTTFKPSSFLYVPPIDKAKQISRQYLLPNSDYDELLAVASSPSPFELSVEGNNYEPKLSISKQSHVNTNNNNVTFTDILTKEKLDVISKVNDIVKDTSEILETASPEDITQYQKNTQSLNYPIDNYLPPDPDIGQQSDEKLLSLPPPQLPKNSRIIAALSPHLEPPFDNQGIQNFSSINTSTLPYLNKRKIPPNTIERTVSLKITIPENIAEYLFKSNSYNLELLNTASSKYLVLTDNIADNSGSNFIPIGKLIENNISNISDSQDLVFSLLADSINTAKEYNNVAQQHFAKPTNTQSQFYNVQTNNLGGISKDTSQLLPAQFPRNQPANLNNAFKIIQPTQNVPTRNENYFKTATQSQYAQSTPQSARTQNNNRNQFYSSEYLRSPLNIQANPEQIYSGQLYQLPVPDVTRQIYNSPHPSVSNLILSNSFLPPYSKQTGGAEAEVEIIPSQIIPTSPLSPVLNSQETTSDQGSSANVFIDDFQIPKDAISAHIQDNIIGTIPHPEDNEKFIKYKKDQSYYFYSHLNSKSNNYEPNSNQTNSIYLLSNLTKPTFQLIPSVGYKLDDETEKQNFLNVFQINDHGNSRKNQVDENINFNRRQDINSDIDFTVIHPTSTYQKPKLNDINIIYNGPNSYSAPQASVGRLDANQNAIKDSSYNARLEKIDVYDKEYGYPKITPVTKFLS